MTWRALIDAGAQAFRSSGAAPEAMDARGSLVVELALCASRSDAFTALKARSRDGGFALLLTVDPHGAVRLELSQGRDTRIMAAKSGTALSHRALRITYSWCLEEGLGVLTVENLLDGWLSQAEYRGPLAIPARVLAGPAARSGGIELDSEVAFAGISSEMEPVGLPASIAEGAPVLTETGPRPIESLRPGDLVQTRDNGLQPVRWVVKRRVPAVGGFRPVRLCAPFFGLTRDLLLGPDQRVLVEGASVEYLFGEEEMFVEARHLVDGRAAMEEGAARMVTYYQLLLDNHEIISVGGLELESLFIGDLCDDPALLRTTLLADLAPDRLPRHARVARPQLRAYEAPTLRNALNA
ncbi:hypothetical protein PSA7680_01305 [Pseudoruegeria aquimaris]|uniref:Hedgehog/Intein (Hint) domain-containing protein n=1 Tax=Pseudoruegeria aquimaris TaxID=393663 RepID=A0A1Y5S0U1_9RHOB|nr:Hint domain-containing protein [Pseudoruegeria aquimaris]SLN28647.1 hypothetical protein PSA7680_01305 [Pseudoruegeria aquimaris]